MLCVNCGQREAEKVILVEAVPLGSKAPHTPREERKRREEELSRLCQRCQLEVMIPAEHRDHVGALFDDQRRMHDVASAQPPSDVLGPLLDALVREALRDPTDVATLREKLVSLVRYLASSEGRTLSDVYWTGHRLSRASNWAHVPEPYDDILLTLSGSTLQALWQPASPIAAEFLPERLLARLQDGR